MTEPARGPAKNLHWTVPEPWGRDFTYNMDHAAGLIDAAILAWHQLLPFVWDVEDHCLFNWYARDAMHGAIFAMVYIWYAIDNMEGRTAEEIFTLWLEAATQEIEVMP